MDEEVLDRAARLMEGARRVLALTGAGVSTESGIPDFRSPGGLWTRFDPSELQYERFLDDPARFWRLRSEIMAALDIVRVRLNPARVALAATERSPRFLGVVTQNIDGLHQRAGSARVVEVHGAASRVRCVDCDAWLPLAAAEAAVRRGEIPPPCPTCGGILKPGTVLFGEPLPADAIARAEAWVGSCDALLVAGSSLEVWPVAGLVPRALARGARVSARPRGDSKGITEVTPFERK